MAKNLDDSSSLKRFISEERPFRAYAQASQTAVNRVLTASPCLRWPLGLLFLACSLLIVETGEFSTISFAQGENHEKEESVLVINPGGRLKQHADATAGWQ